MVKQCKRCGKCCSNILPLSKEEIKRISKTIRTKKIKENKFLLDPNWELRCPFLNNENRCEIYEERPDICRYYTCEKFENHKVDSEFIKKVNENTYQPINIRRQFYDD